ncbi:MAG: DegV family protein [Lachnospiraceae bacterium]|nr:DegV family protein [Lachnospiraceae bacterium]
MKDYIIMTDSTTDLPLSYFKEHHVEFVTLPYIINDETYEGDHQLDVKEFYQKMRDGALPTTTQVNPETALEKYREITSNADVDILVLAFSSGLSGTYNSMRIAAEEFEEEDSEHRIVIIDTLGASMGEGLIVHKAVCNKEKGMSLDENAAWVEENKLHVAHNFTVDDLFHLHRGGRVSKTAAIVGSLASIKPMLHVDDEGHLIKLSTVRGRKKSIHALLKAMEERIGDYEKENDVVFISHGDCEEEARFLANLIEERFGIHNFMINHVGPTIGAHTGPGVIALFYMADHR